MNSENSKTSKPHVLILNFTEKQIYQEVKKAYFYQSIVFIIHKKYIKSSYNNNKFKISAPTWKNKFKLPGRSYSVLDIQDYFEHILKNMDNH